MKTLLSVENFYPRLGGGEVFVDEVMSELKKRGHETYVLYVGDRKPDSQLQLLPKKRFLVFKNLPLVNRTVARQYLANIIWKRILEKTVNQLKPDLILTQLEYTPVTVDVAKKHNIPIVVFIQNYDHFCPAIFKFKSPEQCKGNSFDCLKCLPWSYKLQYPFIKRFLKWHKQALIEAEKLGVIFSDSGYVANILKQFYGVHSEVLNPVLYLDNFIINVNESSISTEQNKKQKQSNNKYITLINPIRTKGAEIVLSVVKSLPEEKFLVVGGKDQHFIEEFRKLANVKYVPWCNDMGQVYSETRILLAPSLWPEPFGRVISEAQINGIPCISSSSGGLPESVGKGGIIIKNADTFNTKAWLSSIKQVDKQYESYSKLAKQNASKLLFDKQWSKFISNVPVLKALEFLSKNNKLVSQ